jgi:hypothetical protein
LIAPSDRLALEQAKARLDRLDYYPAPVDIGRVRVLVTPWLFRVPGLRRYSGYAFWRTIVVRQPDAPDDLLTHELCHIWQGQHRRWHVLWSWATTRYERNPYEVEARRAVAGTSVGTTRI